MNAFSTAPGASPHAPQTLPEPDAPARAISDALTKRIRARIAASPEGRIGFDDFMRMALYEPELGYYAGDAHKFGRYDHDGSDFITAPELSPLFAQACAQQVAEVLRQSAPALLEFGAGSGRLAADLLNALGDACASYAIVELSASLRARQRALIGAKFDSLAAPVLGAAAAVRLRDGLLALEDCDNVADLLTMAAKR